MRTANRPWLQSPRQNLELVKKANWQPNLPLLRRRLAANIRRSRHVAACARPILRSAELNRGEMYYPLHVYICEQCWLVQLEEYESAENIFSDYAYFASFSDSWLKHCEKYCNDMTGALRPW